MDNTFRAYIKKSLFESATGDFFSLEFITNIVFLRLIAKRCMARLLQKNFFNSVQIKLDQDLIDKYSSQIDKNCQIIGIYESKKAKLFLPFAITDLKDREPIVIILPEQQKEFQQIEFYPDCVVLKTENKETVIPFAEEFKDYIMEILYMTDKNKIPIKYPHHPISISEPIFRDMYLKIIILLIILFDGFTADNVLFLQKLGKEFKIPSSEIIDFILKMSKTTSSDIEEGIRLAWEQIDSQFKEKVKDKETPFFPMFILDCLLKDLALISANSCCEKQLQNLVSKTGRFFLEKRNEIRKNIKNRIKNNLKGYE